jgi:hypothetical protein
MQPVQREEVLSIGEYEKIRPHFRARVIEAKKARRVTISEIISAVFENHDSALLQIQEMLRTERITNESGIQHEIETYNDLVPGPRQLKLTLFVEISDQAERDRMLEALAGLEEKVVLEVGNETFVAHSKERKTEGYTRTTAVHYFTFDLSEIATGVLRGAAHAGTPLVALAVTHPAHSARVLLNRATLKALGEDLT